ncbi:GTP-sensing pleiotropic transcriptional regulator CodY, partial [Listeria monocytogenes]
ITRTVIVKAQRKKERAGDIDTRTLGIKGTLNRILNDKFQNELEKMKKN